MKHEYDLCRKGFAELFRDLKELEQKFRNTHKLYVEEMMRQFDNVTKFNLASIMSVDDDPLQTAEAIGGNTTQIKSAGRYAIITGRLFNVTEEATYMEFGFGIVGKGQPYAYEKIFDMGEALWVDYDMDSIYSKKLVDRSWFYTTKSGQKVRTKGQPSGNAFANAFLMVGDEALSVAERYIGNIKGGSGK